MAIYKQSDYEALRGRCVELHEAGWKQLAIAQAFGLIQQTPVLVEQAGRSHLNLIAAIAPNGRI